ncbi:MAG: isocitrate lyase/phosphoenolpyruvate mutase family protein [Alicyclobacillus sp.]|nr:isocitrate lyase/phosphoenolpyruvate mutase family protein [Alicyclobacillus sp.]
MTGDRLQPWLGDELLVVPGVHNALSALLAETAGFRAVFVTGAGVSNNFLGEPDLGLLTFDQLRAHVEQIRLKVSIPVLVDLDAGYGDVKLVYRQGRQLRDLGVNGVFIEDQAQPARCSCGRAPEVGSLAETAAKIQVLRELSDEWLIVGRTDALAAEGEEGAIRRARAYHEAGADVTLIDGPADLAQMERFAALPWPQAANVVEGSRAPLLSASEMERLGFRLVVYANFASRMAMRAMKVAYMSLRMQGDTSVLLDEMMSFEERQSIVGLPRWQRFEEAVMRRQIPGT